MIGPRIPANLFPPPWKLKGEGIIIVFRFHKKWVEENGLLNENQKSNYNGGLGYVMLVNYRDSPVGPYKELLFIPGKFKPNNFQSITKIFVDSDASTENGRFNWGIPKETVPIFWQKNGKEETIGVGTEEEPVLFCKITSGGLPFPASTKLLPINLFQELEGKEFYTRPSGHGWAKIAKIESLKINKDHFPDIGQIKPLFCFKINPFTMEFPLPE
ncbi:acetoacetate decarboxylase family protein [Shivajiella indica]|uniref:Acetoacetate decarboxylase family protein n=1 Tax=Shivajiella indica TaxID=872115 RepID=A0ABW5B2F5_9BACT